MQHPYTIIFRYILLIISLFVISWQSTQAQVKIGTSTDNINQGATLEVESGPYPGNIYRGFLPPKVALVNYATWTLAGNPTDGMMIYNTATTTGNYAVSPGIYFWSNNQWNKVITAANPALITSVDCQPSVAATGTYYSTVPLTAANTKQITVVPASVGPYSITTNEVNGYSFLASGTFTADQVGKPQTISLQASGTPRSGGTDTFTVTAGVQTCTFTVNVINYIDCSGPLTGTLKLNVPLDASNTKQIMFIPQAAGTNRFLVFFYVTDPVSSPNYYFTFVADVTFTADQVGKPQLITLVGNGTPVRTGTFTGSVQIFGPSANPNSSSCSFSVTVVP